MFLEEAPDSPERAALFAQDFDDSGYVMNLTRAWAWLPEAMGGLFDLMDRAVTAGGLTFRDKGILVTATASTLGDSYCSLAWGSKLAAATDPETAVELASGGDPGSLSARETELARWARLVASDPNATTAEDVDRLRSVGMSDGEILAATLYVALRIAFSTVNDALGARPDAQLVAKAPPELTDVVSFGRAPDLA